MFAASIHQYDNKNKFQESLEINRHTNIDNFLNDQLRILLRNSSY